MSFLFWIAVLSSLSKWDEMKVRVRLFADDEWEAEEDKTGFLSVGEDVFNQLYLK